MARKSALGFGPYPIVLTGLFVLSFLAIHTWRVEHAEGPEARRGVRPGSNQPEAGPFFAPPVEEFVHRQFVHRQFVHRQPSEARTPTVEPVPRVTDDRELAPEPQPIDLSLLDALAMPRIRSRVAPPVADRVAVSADFPEAPAVSPSVDVPFETDRMAARARRRPDPPNPDPLPPVPRQDSAIDYQPPTSWPRAAALIEEFESLAVQIEGCAPWSRQVIALLEELETTPSIRSDEARRVLEQLDHAVTERPFTNVDKSTANASLTERASYALTRRLVIWRQVHRIVTEEPAIHVSLERGDVASSLEGVDRLLQPESVARGWRDYLLIDHLKLIMARDDVEESARRALARRILERLGWGQLNDAQRRFLDQPEFVEFGGQLRRWAYEPIDYSEMLADIESLEAGGRSSEAELAEQWRVLRWSPWSQSSELADTIDTYYRNANIRVAISGDFINRMLPAVQTIQEAVDDRILGTAVNGRSTTMARLVVELIPDKMRWRLGLIARGNIDSETWSEKGPVTLFTNGATRYHARKLLTIDRGGVLFHRAEAAAANSAELTDVATEFDGVPFLGSFMRSLARRGHADRMGDANAEVESKVGYRVAQRLDDEVAAKFHEAEENYRERLLRPLRALRLNPVPIDMQTTDTRLIVRYRLAADHQLAAHSPRPLAPGDSLLSVQLHESAINNTIEQLRLDGKQISLVDLYRELSAKFGKSVEPPADIPDDILFAFADQDAVRVRFDDGGVDLTMRFRAMQAGNNLWENFEVHTKFSTDTSQCSVHLVRDDVIELRGQLGFRDRLPMRAIFTAMLARDRKLPVLDPALTANPKLEGAVVSQCVVRDGWIGVALSPEPHVATRPTPVRASVSDRFWRR